MPYIPPEVVEKAREMDLLTYLKSYEPQELVHFGGNTYCTREHDSLKISNGKWCWFSRGIGGYSALDYLIKVKEMPFTQAVETIMRNAAVSPPAYTPAQSQPKEKVLLLPKANRCATHAIEYLHRRGIDYDLIDFCVSTGRLYESYPYYNVVFVGQDRRGKPRYANLRGIGSDFIGDANGSDKHYSFGIPAAVQSDTLNLFESAVDLLSYGTMQKLDGMREELHEVGSHMKNAGLVMLGRPTRQTKALESDKGVLSKLRGFLESCSKAFDRMERGADNLLSKTQSDKAMEEKPSVKLELRQMKAAKSEKSKAPMQQEAVR